MRTTFFVNHTAHVIVPTEQDAEFNISKNMRNALRQHGWTLDDHIEFVDCCERVMDMLIVQKYQIFISSTT